MFGFRKFLEGIRIVPKAISNVSEAGDIDFDTTNNKLNLSNGVSPSPVVTEAHSATLTNKVIDGDNNTVQDLALSSLKTNLADADKFLVRDGSGVVISNTKAVPSGVVVGNTDTQTLTNKTIDGDDNTVQDLALSSLKTNLTDADKFVVRDASGIVVSNSKAVPTGVVVGDTDSQILTNKDIDGGTASNTSRITIPKNSTTNLNSLTRKEATIAYDTTIDTVKFDDGVSLFDLVKNGSSPAASGEPIFMDNTNGILRFKKLVAGANITLTPSSDSLTVSSSGGGGGGSSARIEILEQKLEAEHYGIISERLDNSVGQSFKTQPLPSQVSGVLFSNYSSGTVLDVVYNPKFINDSDKDTDSTTGWVAQSAATSLTTSSTSPKIGTNWLQFDKDSSATNARIRYDRGSANMNINGNTEMYFYINLPSVTDLVDIEVRIDIDSTNYRTFSATTQYDSSPLAVGENVIYIDLAGTGTNSGTGWNPSQQFRYLHVGLNTGSAATTYTAVQVDSIMFGLIDAEQIINAGDQISINDTTNKESFIIDSANTKVDGPITIASALANTYSGGSAASAGVTKRITVSISGDNQGNFDENLSGDAEAQQEVRISRILRENQVGINVKAFAEVNTPQFYEVTAVSGSDIDVLDPADQSNDLVSGDVIHIFRAIYNDGKKDFIHRGDATITATSIHAGDTTTITLTPPAGTAVGDIAIKKHISTQASLVAIGSNENFVSLTEEASPNGVVLEDTGIPYPNAEYIVGHYKVGGINNVDATNNLKGYLVDLTTTGTPNLGVTFKNGQFGASGLGSTDYFSISNADAQTIKGTVADGLPLVVSCWAYLTPFTGAARYIVSKSNAGGTGGWRAYAEPSSNNVTFAVDSTVVSVPFNTNQWNHIVLMIDSTTAVRGWVNGVASSVSAATSTAGVNDAFHIGVNSDSLNSPLGAGSAVADVIIQRQGPEFTQDDVNNLYNRGLSRVVGSMPMLKYRYADQVMTGQKLSLKVVINRVTNLVKPFLTKIGAIKN